MKARYLCVLIGLATAACAPAPSNGAQAPKQPNAGVGFAKDIAPLLRQKCATCHLTGQEAGNLALTPQSARASLVNVPSTEAEGKTRAAPGKPDDSYLIMKLRGTHIEHGGAGAQMPFGAPPLTDAEISLIAQWIEQGAQNN